MGLANYYHEFIRGYAEMASPLTDLLGKGKFVWTEAATAAFEQVKSALCSAPVLRLPDFTRPFVIEPDASANAVGAVLL